MNFGSHPCCAHTVTEEGILGHYLYSGIVRAGHTFTGIMDNRNGTGSPWTTTGYTNDDGQVAISISAEELGNQNTVSVREVWGDDYIPFSGTNENNVSAVIYCDSDAANFDNLEWISNVSVENTYHCVAWNVPVEPEPVSCEITIKSDAQDLVVEKNAYAKLLTTIHTNWVTSIPGSIAKWIWGDDPVQLPTTVSETQTFKKSFTWNGLTVTSAVLTIASDNSHAVTLGTFSGGDAGEFNYGATKNYNVAAAIATGTNTLTVEVENFALAGSNASTNPAGLIYELKIKGTGTSKDCGVVVPVEPEKPKVSEVTMCKIDGNKKALAGWNLMLLGDKVTKFDVAATSSIGVDRTLDTGAYVALASGTWDNNRGPLNIVDAEYSTEDNWVTQMDGFAGYGTDILELQLNGAIDPNADWGAYNSLHRYARGFAQAATGTANFKISDTFYGDNSGSLFVEVYEGYAGLTSENGCVTFKNVPFGTYNVDEIMKDGWVNVSGLGEVKVDAETETFTITNRPVVVPTEPVATVVAHKIVCTDEAELPNWGAVEGNTISSTTAATWVATHPSCKFEAGWQFEWATSSASNPDNLLPATALNGVAGGNWTTFGPTDVSGKTQVQLTAAEISGGGHIWMREVLKNGYIPFTYGPTNTSNANNFSAEMYCHTDVFNYDNYDQVNGIAVNNTYNCVAFNHIKKTEEPAPICKADVNLLTNGGFEAPAVTNAAGWDIFDLATYPVLGWAASWINPTGAPATTSLELHSTVNGWLHAEGAQHTELDSDWQGPAGTSGEAASVAISQTVPTVTAANYSLSWSFSPRPNTSAAENVLEVLVNNVLVASTTAAGAANTVWTTGNYAFVGTGAPVTVTFRDAGNNNSEGTFLDNVSLNCRPATNGDGDDDGEPEIPGPVATSTPTTTPTVTEDDDRNGGGGGNGGTLVRRSPSAQPTVAGLTTDGAGGDFVTPDGQVLGDQVSAVPYGAPGTGHGGSSASTGLTILQLLFVQRRKDLI